MSTVVVLIVPKKTTHNVTKAQCRYDEHWGIIAFPTCSWRVEWDPQQGRLAAVRYVALSYIALSYLVAKTRSLS